MALAAKRHGSHAATEHNHSTRGRLLDRGWRYDLEVWVFDTFLVGGKVQELRQQVLARARLRTGQAFLDVGCGTGTLAIGAAALVGQSGRVAGIDPAPRQISRARSKAHRAGLEIDFQPGVIEAIPYPDQTFDAVTSTLMMHHLPQDLKQQGLAEILRVLKPCGRVVVADFNPGQKGHPQSQHGDTAETTTDELPDLLSRTGFRDIQLQVLAFPREHHGWSGATLISARKS